MDQHDFMNKRSKNGQHSDTRVLTILLASAGIIILGCLVLNGFTWSRLKRNTDRQIFAFDRLAQYSAVLSTLQDIELGQRGFVISGRESQRELFEDSRQRYAKEWAQLVLLETVDGQQPEDLAELRKASDELVKSSIQIVFLRQKEGHEQAIIEFTEKRPRWLMRTVRDLYRDRQKTLEREIRKYSEASEKDFGAGLATSMAMGMLALGIGAISLFLLRRVFKEVKRSERYALSMLRSEEERRQKDVFLAMMSHEIRTPLNAIIGFSQLAQKEEMSDKGQRYVDSILSGGHSLLLLINDILDLSKLEAGRMELKQEPTELREMLKFMERLFMESAGAKGVSFTLEYSEDLPPALILDSIRLRQVLMNLIGNAVKFTQSGDVRVKVVGEREQENSSQWQLHIEIIDTGPGICDEDLIHIFEPFYQSETGRGGTGLGLSIVYRFVKLMGGMIDVESRLGEGTKFIVKLNRLGVSARITPEKGISETPTDFNNLAASKILAVDDNETNRLLITETFEETHHEVMTANDGEMAVELVKSWKPDLVLMDLRMPVKDGPTAAEEIKSSEEYSLIPIIAVTAGSLPGTGDSPLTGGCFDGALRKPFTREEIYEALALFLKPASAVDEVPEDSMIQEEDQLVSEELLNALETLLIERWPDVKAGMTVSEVTEFYEELDALSRDEACRRLTLYSGKLKGAVESFSFGEMERVLNRFPDLVSELKESLQ